MIGGFVRLIYLMRILSNDSVMLSVFHLHIQKQLFYSLTSIVFVFFLVIYSKREINCGKIMKWLRRSVQKYDFDIGLRVETIWQQNHVLASCLRAIEFHEFKNYFGKVDLNE